MNPNRESFFEAVHEQPFKTVMKRYAVETAGVKIKKKTNHIIMQLKHAVKRIIGYNR